MIKQLINLPRDRHFYLACSGGVDSMFGADFFCRGSKNFTLAYFHHGTSQADDMERTVRDFSNIYKINMVVGHIKRAKHKDESTEEFFRNERYKWLCSLGNDVVTCHHLGDAVEGFLFKTLHGNPKVMSCVTTFDYSNKSTKVYRPFLTNTKQDLIDWCIRHDVKWLEDTSNQDIKYMRNLIRHVILPQALKVNPGLFKVIKKKILQEIKIDIQ